MCSTSSEYRPLPAWYYYYFVEFDGDKISSYSKVLEHSFEYLVSIHQRVKQDPRFHVDFYNESNLFTIHSNFFDYFMKATDDELLSDRTQFLEYLLNDQDINCKIDFMNFRKHYHLNITRRTHNASNGLDV